MSCCGQPEDFGYVAGSGNLPNPSSFPALSGCCDVGASYVIPGKPQPPQITSPLFVNEVPTIFFTYVITASNNPTLYFAPSFPSWMTFDGVDTLSGTPPSDTSSNVFSFVVGAVNESGQVTVTVQGGLAPYVTSASNPPSTSGYPFSYLITANNSPTSFDAKDLPVWALFDGINTVSGTPPILCVDAEYVFSVTATNIYGTSVDHVVTLNTVKFPDSSITSPLTVPAEEGIPFSYLITANNSPTSFDVSSLPPWAAFDGIDTITGTPTVDCFVTTYPKTETASLTAENMCGGGPSSTLHINETSYPTSIFTQPTVNISGVVSPLGYQVYYSPYGSPGLGQLGAPSFYPLGFTESQLQKIFDGSTNWIITCDVLFSGVSDLVGSYSKDFSGTHSFTLAQQTCPPTPQTISFNVRGGDSTINIHLFNLDSNGKWVYKNGSLYYPYIYVEIVDNNIDFVFYTFVSANNFEGDCSKLWQGTGINGGSTIGASITSANASTTGTMTFDDALEYNASIYACDNDVHANQVHAGGIDISFS